ncbi:hypothetical protein [Methanosarcina mazei]|uniref:hypothetical protein n=1 Tax=Methanosarcina mazei TaxID=2209 RepID=UPI0019100714|nr:hypothetical protein [Methanosarcina mazei]UWJ21510.1 hypothetical protein MSMAT_0253 [Methanosarcina mazei TMA]BBL66276.1 hypothetical protein MmazTMA_32530 [Methanosarcina mazei]
MAIERGVLAAGRSGLKVKEMLICFRYDVDGSTENPVRHEDAVLLKIFMDVVYSKPLSNIFSFIYFSPANSP